MANQHDVRKLLPPHLVDNVQDLHVEIDIGLEQVRSFGNPGECRGEHLVVICGEQPRHATPAPRAVPRTVNENKGGHILSKSVAVNAWTSCVPRQELGSTQKTHTRILIPS